MSGGDSRRRVAGVLEEQAYVALMRTADALTRKAEKLLDDAGVSITQYNVLRILRGSPEGLPCGEIAARMITRDPDVTRLLNRLEERELVSRCRETEDRRMVKARITPQGLRLLADLDRPVLETHHGQLGHLGRAKLRALIELLEEARPKAG